MMAGWDRVADWLAALVVASLTWVSGLAADLPGDPSAAQDLSVTDERPALMLGWAQEAETPPIEPLDDATSDVETLDESAPPVQVDQPAGDMASVAAAPAADEDIELLDQGSPPAALPAVAPPASTTYIAPPVATGAATNYVPPTEPVATGSVLPPGFGTGQVHVNAGSAEFPAGLQDCHVGAVTGRAYVGIDCGEGGDDSFVGHAPTFEDFPFVVVGDFPFDDRDVELDDPGFPFTARNDDGFPFATGNAIAEDDSDVIVTAARPLTSPSDDPNVNPVIETSGAATAQFAQRARDRDPRARAENQSDKAAEESGKDKGKKGSARADSALADGETSAQSNDDKDTRHNADKKKQRAKDDSKHMSNKGKAKEKAKDRDKKAKHKKSNHERTRHKRNENSPLTPRYPETRGISS
jgi:hypothetical protein